MVVSTISAAAEGGMLSTVAVEGGAGVGVVVSTIAAEEGGIVAAITAAVEVGKEGTASVSVAGGNGVGSTIAAEASARARAAALLAFRLALLGISSFRRLGLAVGWSLTTSMLLLGRCKESETSSPPALELMLRSASLPSRERVLNFSMKQSTCCVVTILY